MAAPIPLMIPDPGSRLLRFVGDRVRFSLGSRDGKPLPDGWRVLLRTNLGRAPALRDEIIGSLGGGRTFAGASWRDVPMSRQGNEWVIDLPLTQVGFFRAKAYATDRTGHQHWPAGDDVGIAIHPDSYRTGNTIYCAFTRLFGQDPIAAEALIGAEALAKLDQRGFAVIPPSGTLRDLCRNLPHIMDTLGCRILHLLPVNPTPTTYARFGRFGSPYAVQDLTGIDPALVVFDKRTTGIDQFRELTYAAHCRGGRVFLDMVINHTGWASTLLADHPDWFERGPDGTFRSPGAWGNTWEDLVELDHSRADLWVHLAEAFMTWCRRGVDGFRCDAGYMVPAHAWRYITARVRQEFPDTVFLLEGLGGAWADTERLLGDGGMQWAYSELFQNYAPNEIATYLDHCIHHGQRTGLLVHYSETHDNDRLAKRGRSWSLMRNQLSALTSISGGFGFTCGVEWLDRAKIDVHRSQRLDWDTADHLLAELAHLTRLLAEHPCFFDGANLGRLSAVDSPVYALCRTSAEGLDQVLVLINTDVDKAQEFVLDLDIFVDLGEPRQELLGQSYTPPTANADGALIYALPPGASLCLAASMIPFGLAGDEYRRARAQAAWAYRALGRIMPVEDIGPCHWRSLAMLVHDDPRRFLAATLRLDPAAVRKDLLRALAAATAGVDQSQEPRMVATGRPAKPPAAASNDQPQVVVWEMRDLGRVVPVPPGHWLMLHDLSPFTASLDLKDGSRALTERAIAVAQGYVAYFSPCDLARDAELAIDNAQDGGRQARGLIRFLGPGPDLQPRDRAGGMVLLTNGIGGMARLNVDLGTVSSKYDCLLGANLHPSVPCDRHVLAKRVRVWAIADGFISPLDRHNLAEFTAGPPALWRFIANAGDGRTVEIHCQVDMLAGRNTTVLRFSRHDGPPLWGNDLPPACDVRLSVRIDIEDRSFHSETKRSPEAEAHFADHSSPLADRPGFLFAPADDRRLRVYSDAGSYRHETEWTTDIPHPVEASRGMTGAGDAYSPGWFDIALAKGRAATIVVTADGSDPTAAEVAGFAEARKAHSAAVVARAPFAPGDAFGRQLALAADAFVVRRDQGKTVIAGYPWFLDWGRDSLICARGLITAGLAEDVRQLLTLFGRFEQGGTLPNFFHGEDASNRDTSDAPLWYGVVCEEAAAVLGDGLYQTKVNAEGRTIADVLAAIAEGYSRGAANGINMDVKSGLVWSPSHFTWMDTNHPAGTPREGYPVEIQALWVRLLRQLDRLGAPRRASGRVREGWGKLGERALASLLRLFWLDGPGYLADLLVAPTGVEAEDAVVSNALRPNQLFAVSLGLLGGEPARRCVDAATRHLIIPGALRSLAPLPVSPPLPILGVDGKLLNNPVEPYWGRYLGDEDTRRKPAYHNGTAWTWVFPSYCEAMALAWDKTTAATAAARSYLGSMDRLLSGNCAGQLPEILDGDAPHEPRGCDAQAWGATEALRVWKLLG